MTKTETQEFHSRLWDVVEIARRHADGMSELANLFNMRAELAEKIYSQIEEIAIDFDLQTDNGTKDD